MLLAFDISYLFKVNSIVNNLVMLNKVGFKIDNSKRFNCFSYCLSAIRKNGDINGDINGDNYGDIMAVKDEENNKIMSIIRR